MFLIHQGSFYIDQKNKKPKTKPRRWRHVLWCHRPMRIAPWRRRRGQIPPLAPQSPHRRSLWQSLESRTPRAEPHGGAVLLPRHLLPLSEPHGGQPPRPSRACPRDVPPRSPRVRSPSQWPCWWWGWGCWIAPGALWSANRFISKVVDQLKKYREDELISDGAVGLC